ncbi:MAG: thioredoxin [Clostridia bacterium]|nr:thioredoxin [Clostridia bacterium]
MIHHIENNQINSEVLKSDKLVIVDFYATWCMPCQMLTPILVEIDKENEDVEIFKVNVDENQETAIRYDIVSVPTLIFFKDGKEVERQVGLVEKEKLEKIIRGE